MKSSTVHTHDEYSSRNYRMGVLHGKFIYDRNTKIVLKGSVGHHIMGRTVGHNQTFWREGWFTYMKSGFFRKGSTYHVNGGVGVLGHFMLIRGGDLPEIGTWGKGSINVGIDYSLT